MCDDVYASLTRYDVGAWVYLRSIQGCRKVTVLGYDDKGYALYAEGWLDAKTTHSTNLTATVNHTEVVS